MESIDTSDNNLQQGRTSFHKREQTLPMAQTIPSQTNYESSSHRALYLSRKSGEIKQIGLIVGIGILLLRKKKKNCGLSYLTYFEWYGSLNMKCSMVIAFRMCPPTFTVAWETTGRTSSLMFIISVKQCQYYNK